MLYLSNSEIQLFKECKRKWWMSQHLGYREDPEPVYFTEGTLWHDIMEAYYLYGYEAATKVLNYAEMEAFDDRLAYAKYRSLLRAYNEEVETTAIDQDLRVERVEHIAEMELIPGEVVLRGKIDMLVFDEALGIHVLMDHKFLKSFTYAEQTLLLNQQMRTYALLHREDNGLPAVRKALYNMVRKVDPADGRSKPPYFQRDEAYITDDVLDRHLQELRFTAHEILAMKDWLETSDVVPPTVSAACGWCPFLPVCSLIGDEAGDWNFTLQLMFMQDDPNKRYN